MNIQGLLQQRKIEITENIIEKAGGLPIGTKRKHADGIERIKTANGWRPVSGGKKSVDVKEEGGEKKQSKSAQFKEMFAQGKSVAEVAKETQSHYSFVYGVHKKWKSEGGTKGTETAKKEEPTKTALSDRDISLVVTSWFLGSRNISNDIDKIFSNLLEKNVPIKDIEEKVKEVFPQVQKNNSAIDWYGLQSDYSKHEDAFKRWIKNGIEDAKDRKKYKDMGFENRKPKIYRDLKHAQNRAKKFNETVLQVNDLYWTVKDKDVESVVKHGGKKIDSQIPSKPEKKEESKPLKKLPQEIGKFLQSNVRGKDYVLYRTPTFDRSDLPSSVQKKVENNENIDLSYSMAILPDDIRVSGSGAAIYSNPRLISPESSDFFEDSTREYDSGGRDRFAQQQGSLGIHFEKEGGDNTRVSLMFVPNNGIAFKLDDYQIDGWKDKNSQLKELEKWTPERAKAFIKEMDGRKIQSGDYTSTEANDVKGFQDGHIDDYYDNNRSKFRL